MPHVALQLRLQRFLVAAAARNLLRSAHDCSDGGLAVTLAEACIGAPYAGQTLGARIELGSPPEAPPDGLLYAEDAGRVVASCGAPEISALLALAGEHGVPAEPVGEVGAPGGTLEIVLRGRGTSFAWQTRELRRIYLDAIPRRMRTDG